MITKYFFFAIVSLFAISYVSVAYADEPLQSIRFKDRLVEHFPDGIVRETFGMTPYVQDGNEWIDRKIANNGTHFNVYSEMGSFSFNKADCTITQYAKGFNPITGTAQRDDIIIGDWFWTIARKNGGAAWQVIDPMIFSCSINTFQNSTGKYLEMTRSHASGSYLKVTLAAPNGEPVEDFAELYMNVPAWSGNKFAFVLWAKDVNTDTLTFRNGTTIQIPDGVTYVNKSQLTVNSINIIKDGNAFYFDWKKAITEFKTLLLNKTGANLDVQFGFNDSPKTLNTGQKMFLDPTYGYTTGTLYTAASSGALGAACPGGPFASPNDGIAQVPRSTDSSTCRRNLAQWDVSTIPDGVTVTAMLVRYDNTLSGTARNCDMKSIEFKPSTATAITRFYDSNNGTTFISNDNSCTTTGNDKVETLPSTAYTDLESKLSADWWAISLLHTNQARDASAYEFTASNMELQVTYQVGAPDPINDLAVSDFDADSVDLTYSEPGLNGGTLQVYQFNYTTPCGTPLTALPNGTTATTHTVSGLTANTCYSFRATAATEGGRNDGGNIVNVTTLAFNQANFTVGNLSFDDTNQDVIPIFFERDDISDTALLLNVTYPDTWELACDFTYKFAQENQTYNNLSFVTVDADSVESSFQFNNVDREIIDVLCWNENGTGEGRYVITQTSFPLLEYIQNFDDGQYGTSGSFGTIDIVYLAVIIVSLVGLNRTNESVGAGFMIVITAAMAYFEFITIPTAAISGIGLVVMLIIITTRKD